MRKRTSIRLQGQHQSYASSPQLPFKAFFRRDKRSQPRHPSPIAILARSEIENKAGERQLILNKPVPLLARNQLRSSFRASSNILDRRPTIGSVCAQYSLKFQVRGEKLLLDKRSTDSKPNASTGTPG